MLLTFYDLESNTYTSQMGLIGAIFYLTNNTVYQNIMQTIMVFQSERQLFKREQDDKVYKVLPYFLSKIIIEIPITLIMPAIISIILYFGIGLTITAGNFFNFYMTLAVLYFCASSYGYFLASIFNRIETAVLVAPLFIQPINLFGGYYANAGRYPAWI